MGGSLNQLEETALVFLRLVLGDNVEIRAQDSYLPGTPDFVVESLKLIIEIDGKFWHDTGGRMTAAGLRIMAAGDKERGEFWLAKASENRRRDKETNRRLKELGYRVVRLKETRLRGPGAVAYVSRTLGMAMTR